MWRCMAASGLGKSKYSTMPVAITRSYSLQVAIFLFIVCFIWKTATCCENATDGSSTLNSLHHPTLSSCITEMIRALCNSLRPSPLKRNTELINSILGLPRILQNAGR
ncbi:uncharacterized protein LOC118185370 [Stegodyphus dumicola]|uniref:uncharacterized protein LOC118185370 n=1 Tax=Stegodyphus dumicola TaxID=202533 RepID=UPI0015AFD532|nr:uncharacterized protein LOC118185370 [Stegodyphus dumicola]